jgi:hypothetical protein
MAGMSELLDLATLTPELFEPLVGEAFSMTGAGGEQAVVELSRVRIPERKPPRGFRQPFALEFRPPEGPALPQGLYRLENAALGCVELLVTPVVTGTGNYCYEAVFG